MTRSRDIADGINRIDTSAADATAITVDASENVGIGTSSPTAPLMVNGAGTNFPIVVNSTDQYAGIAFADNTTTSNAHVAVYADGNALVCEAGNSERMRISSGGNMHINTGGSQAGAGTPGTTIRNIDILKSTNTTSASNQMVFYNPNGAVGTIQTSGSSTSFNTSSDYRLKENVADLTGAIARVKSLQPKRFNFIADDSVTVDGFLAHEAQTVVPEAVHGTHNEVETWTQDEIDAGDAPDNTSAGDNKVDGDGNTIPIYQGIDQAKLVPLLTAALKEAIAKIEALETQNADFETRIAALETN